MNEWTSVPERRLPAGHSISLIVVPDVRSVPERRLPAGHSEWRQLRQRGRVYLSDGYPQATAPMNTSGAGPAVYLSDGYPQATATP